MCLWCLGQWLDHKMCSADGVGMYLIGFITWIKQHPIWQREGHSEGLFTMEDFKRKKVVARELLTKGNKRLLLDRDVYFGGEGNWEGFYHADCLFFLLGARNGDGPHDRLPCWCLTRKFQTGWLRLYFQERLKQQLGQASNLGLVSWALAQVTPLGPVVFSLTVETIEKRRYKKKKRERELQVWHLLSCLRVREVGRDLSQTLIDDKCSISCLCLLNCLLFSVFCMGQCPQTEAYQWGVQWHFGTGFQLGIHWRFVGAI